jgi:hypothetical protein
VIGRVVDLVDDSNCGTALLAATFALRHAPQRAERALAELATRKSPLSFSAELVLRQWRKGTLEFAWDREA